MNYKTLLFLFYFQGYRPFVQPKEHFEGQDDRDAHWQKQWNIDGIPGEKQQVTYEAFKDFGRKFIFSIKTKSVNQ